MGYGSGKIQGCRLSHYMAGGIKETAESVGS